ncbi:MAG: Holliday junction resolvase RuvX [Pseudomonadota bacterium]|uniref:Holliday junction resolvase RuvX n=2 Tax=unclassified Alcanivorax TaxID=2638842 RepID=UPI000789E330|nr:Holliday junction resolvase RuvX [Alcanivorax sp. NBRC 102024]MEE2602105.1 Holliday junction resolvase RuvX [Pseudomonadota bacterium]
MILAFDYGTHKIGVASGNSLLGTATPLKALPCKNTQPNWDDIAALLKEWEPEGLVVGLPLNMDGSESESTARAKKFANRLKGRFGMKVWLVDERLSTREARERTGIRQADSRVDSMAAVIIAEGFLSEGGEALR